jgi:hypothetical protein
MRKIAALIVGVFVASLAMVAVAQADDIQSITANLTPSKRSKKSFKPAQIYVEILTADNTTDPTTPEQPPSATRTAVDFPKNAKFDPKAVPKCKVTNAALDGTSTDAAVDACGNKSIVSVGSSPETTTPNHTTGTSAWVTIDSPGPNSTLEVPVVVTAYNGKEKNSLYLHARANLLGVTTVLVGKIKDGPKGYGKQLDVKVPPLQAGAIARFTVTVKNGKYVQARCKNKNMKFQAITKFSNFPTATDDFSSKCKQK